MLHKILIADPAQEWLSHILSEAGNELEIRTCTTGVTFLETFYTFLPHLVIVDLMLPEMHGIEILKRIKGDSKYQHTGVMLTSFHSMIQNYNSAMELQADYMIDKPCTPHKLLGIISAFFSHTLPPIPIHKIQREQILHLHPHKAPLPEKASYIRFWGTRGSNPVSGPEYVRFGGNTPSLEIRTEQDLLLIDAGSGIRDLGQSISWDNHQEISILFSHTHLDHLSGFPFFYPLHQAEHKISIWAPVGFEKTTEETFADLFAYAYFPVAFQDIQPRLFFHDLRDSRTYHFGSIQICTHYAYHPGSTLCFIIHIQGKKIAYVTDNEFLFGNQTLQFSKIDGSLLDPYRSFISFISGCDIVIHEAQYTQEEYASKIGWGHSSLTNVALLMKYANIKHWIVTHHDPKHTDTFLLEKEKLHIEALETIEHDCLVEFAYDGMILSLRQ